MVAAIAALDLRTIPDNINDFGVVVAIIPRTHREPGARFELHMAEVLPIAEIVQRMTNLTAAGDRWLQLMKERQAAKRQESGGEYDYAAMIVWALNIGAHRVPGGRFNEVTFKELSVPRRLLRSTLIRAASSGWEQLLREQIKLDLPYRPG